MNRDMESTDDRSWLNEDFKVSNAAVTLCLKELTRDEDLPAGSVLQIQSVTNVSIPMKSQSEFKTEYDPKHHILKICLTDGKETAYGILHEEHPKLTPETPPGTKVKAIRNITFGSSRILKLTRGNVEVLGGYVEKLVEQWRVAKEHDKKSAWGKLITNPGDDGPPKFKPLTSFTQSVVPVGNIKDLRNAKAMNLLEEVKAKAEQNQGKTESKTEFDMQRQEAILDLTKQTASKKAFSVSKQFPQPAPLPAPPSMSTGNRRERTNSANQDEQPREFSKPRFSSRKSKQEEEELLSEYTYRRGQPSLTDHFSDFFGKGPAPPAAMETFGNNGTNHRDQGHGQHHQNSNNMDTMSSLGRTGVDDSRFQGSQTFHRGGGGGRGHGQYHQNSNNVDSMSSSFGRMEVDDDSRFQGSQTFHRGGGGGRGGESRPFSSRGQGPRGRSRGGRGRGRGEFHHREPPPVRTSSATYVPDLSSFPSLGVDAHFVQKK